MFVDLRGSTRIAESRLPYDVVFIMNKFFAEMYEALRATNGYYAQFRGDGLLALYGLESDLRCVPRCDARAAEMQRRWKCCRAVLRGAHRAAADRHRRACRRGHRRTMAPGGADLLRIGDNINIAARFEA